MKLAFRLTAWALVVAIVVVTLGPPRLRPVTEMSQNFEHGFAFVVLGAAFCLGYSGRLLQLIAASVPLIGVLELLQLWVPGRHARLSDFVVNCLATIVGLACAAVFQRLVARPQKP